MTESAMDLKIEVSATMSRNLLHDFFYCQAVQLQLLENEHNSENV